MILTIDEKTIELPAPVQAALEADALAQARPVADVLTDVLAERYTTRAPEEIAAPDGEFVGRLKELRGYGMLAGTGLSTAALLAERREEVAREYGPVEEKSAGSGT